MCIIVDFIEGILIGKVAEATKPSEYYMNVRDVWSIRHINTLPRELLLHIFRFLSHNQLKTVLQVCNQWREVGEDPILWKNFKLVVTGIEINIMPAILNIKRFRCLQNLEVNGYSEKEKPELSGETLSTILESPVCKLTIKNCNLSQLSEEKISSMVLNLKSLSLWQIEMKKEQTKMMFGVLSKSKYLSEIDIGYGYMNLLEVSPLLLAKAFNRRKKVNIGHTKLTEDQVTRLFEVINKRTTIRSLDVGYRDLSFLDDDLLRSALQNLESVNICPSKLITTPFVFSHKKIIY